MLVQIPVSVGELLDKVTILEIKTENIHDMDKLDNIDKELSMLESCIPDGLFDDVKIQEEYAHLYDINLQLWNVEDDIRKLECEMKCDTIEFISLARSVYLLNDERAQIKRTINELTGSIIVEEKDYVKY